MHKLKVHRKPMSTADYCAVLEQLELKPYSKHTGMVLGLSHASLARLAKGRAPVSDTLALLLEMYLRHGVTNGHDH